jgi:hypothetical protein
VVSLFSHVDGVEWTVGVPGVAGASALAAPRSCFRGLTWGQQAARASGAVRGFFWVKAQRLIANDGDACGCRYPLGGVIVVILSMLWLWVKTLDLVVSTAASLCVVTLLGASSWSLDSTILFHCLRWQVLVFRVFLFFIFDLLCKRFSSPPCIGSAVMALFIKRGERLFRG